MILDFHSFSLICIAFIDFLSKNGTWSLFVLTSHGLEKKTQLTVFLLGLLYLLRGDIHLMLPKWADEICFEMAKLASFTPKFECVTVLSPLLGNGKHFPFLYFKGTVVILLDYTGNRNFHRHSSVVVFATTFIQRLSKCLPGFLLLHDQLSIINSNQLKSITFRRIGE